MCGRISLMRRHESPIAAKGLKIGKRMRMPVIIETKLTPEQVRGYGFSYNKVDPYFRATIGKVNTSSILMRIRKKE